MTPRQKAERAYEMLMAGLAYGQKTGDISVNRFPDGFNDETGRAIIKITEDALTAALDVYALGGIARRYRDEFENGYRIGLRNAFAGAARAVKEPAIG